MTEVFANQPAWMWFGIVLLMLYGFIWLGSWKRSKLREMADRGPLRGLILYRGGGIEIIRGVSILLATTLLVITMMRPQHGTRSTDIQNLGIDLVLTIDASKSMKVKDVVPDRLTAAHLECTKLLNQLSGGRVGLVPFAGLAFIQTPLTSDFQVVSTYLKELKIEDMPRGGTSIGRAILESLRALLPPDTLVGTTAEIKNNGKPKPSPKLKTEYGSDNKAIILFTDGEDHEGDAIEAATLAKRFNVRIYTVGVGTAQGRPVPLVNDKGQVIGTMKQADGKAPLFSEINMALLEKIADTTGGKAFHLGPEGMGQGLLQAIDALEKKEFSDTFKELGADRYQWPLIPAIVLLLLESFVASRPRRRRRLAS
jgi:Ca-activated chloride channel family protein